MKWPFQKKYTDPITGDSLTLSEVASWHIQSIIRRWLFLGIITAITAWVWFIADPIWLHPVTDQWNLAASYAAIFIEGVTAMALINQTRRDAQVIREIRRISQRIEKIAVKILADEEVILGGDSSVSAGDGGADVGGVESLPHPQ